MRVCNLFRLDQDSSVQRKMKDCALAAAVVTGGMIFCGDASADLVLSDGGFEGDNAASGPWGAYTKYTHPYNGIQGPQLSAVGTLSDYGYNDNVGFEIGTGFHGLGTGTTQTATITGATDTQIDAGLGRFAYSAWLASWSGDANTPALQLEWLDGSSSVIGSPFVLDRGTTTNQLTTAENLVNGNASGNDETDPDFWALYEIKGEIPLSARSARVTFIAGTGHGNSGANDWYADAVIVDTVAIPEPGTLVLLASLGGMCLLRRRKA